MSTFLVLACLANGFCVPWYAPATRAECVAFAQASTRANAGQRDPIHARCVSRPLATYEEVTE